MTKTFQALAPLEVDGKTYHYHRLDALRDHGLDVSRLPFSLKILLENLLRFEDGRRQTIMLIPVVCSNASTLNGYRRMKVGEFARVSFTSFLT